ncbi:ATP-dependent DNA helicase RecG [Botrimarina sp.]|uniref:ATP-dependent DNA helicase RecG n=1 Tax=Botrimarina sp. TaxID=2795802 RepID=UPI0032ED1432
MDRALATPIAQLSRARRDHADALARKGLRTVADLLFLFPRDYEDFRDRRAIADLVADEPQTVVGEVTDVESRGTGFGKSRLGVIVEDASGALRATWFNQLFLRDKFRVGRRVQLSGKPKKKGLRWEMTHPRITWLGDDPDDDPSNEGLLPVYPLTEGVPQHAMRRLVTEAVDGYADLPDEVLAAEVRRRNALLPIADALRAIHRPADEAARDAGRRRFVFQELLTLQLALAARRRQHQFAFSAPAIEVDTRLDARIRRLLPFELTDGQRAAIEDITADLASPTPMNRLLQGDVGSGKTIVALYAMLATVACGWQAVLLAPTEVLARQHADTLSAMLRASRVRFRLLVGGMTDAEKQQVRAGLKSGDVDLAIGTHALLQEKVAFAKLGLAVVDEQHKFGVRQRAALRDGDRSPHYLVMTATPIPRTLSMTQFGDLDISSITDLPPGRQPVRTYLVERDQQSRWWDHVRRQLDEGRQAYVVAPLVDDSEAIDAASVERAFERLTHGELRGYRLGLLHGRMAPADKDAAMERFRGGATQVLVSTTVIEVGVDVPNATVMVVASPGRFGLSQLHQLRGRVGRGRHPGACALLAPAELSDAALARLQAFVATTDGFELAEIDFGLRGPGDLFGDRQSGLPPLRIADLVRDREVLAEARDAAADLFAKDPGLKSPENTLLRRQMLRRYGASLELGDVG